MILITKFHMTGIACICFNVAAANAMDIPMSRSLAEKQLDSKTCYSEVMHNGQLAGIELQNLLISQDNKLTTLNPVGSFDVGDGKTRKYRSGVTEISITPLSIKKKGDDVEFEIHERAKLVVTGNGKPIKLDVNIKFKCSP